MWKWELYFVIAMSVLDFALPKKLKKLVNIAVFIEDDDQFVVSTLAVISSANTIAKYSNIELNPIIVKTTESDMLETGETGCRLIEQGIAATFGPELPKINEFIQSVSSSLEIPQFQTFWNPKLRSFSLKRRSDKSIQTFNLYPSPYILSKAIATLVRENDWKTFTVIYEDDDGLLRLQDVLKQHHHPSDPVITFRKLEFKESLRPLLKEIKNSNVKHILLDCHVEHIIDILLEARELELLTQFYSYIITNLDAHTLDWSVLGNARPNITTLRLVDPKSSAVSQATMNWNAILSSSIFDVVKDSALQRELVEFKQKNPFFQIESKKIRIKTLLLYDALNLFISIFSHLNAKEEIALDALSCATNEISQHGKRFSDALMQQNNTDDLLMFPLLTGQIPHFNPFGYRSNHKLQIAESGFPTEFETSATWDSRLPDEINNTISTEQRDTELKKRISQWKFKVVSRLGDPYLMKKDDSNEFDGYAVELMEHICKPTMLNCTFTVQLVRDGHYGNYDPDTKQWNGLIRDLLDNQADLAVGDLTITYERKTAVDFTVPFMNLGINILYAEPVKKPPELLAFSHPLSLDVWLYMATAYLLISMIIFLVARLNPNEWENPHPCNPNPQELENIWSIRNCCWLVIGSLMGQGCDLLPKGISTRLITGIWWFFALIMLNCYTANMAAFLTNERMGLTIKGAEDLAEQNKIQYGCLEGGATASFFKENNFSTYHRMWVQMESADPSVFETNNKDGVKRVLNNKGKYAFLMESSSIEYETERNCDLTKVSSSNLDSKGYGIAMPKNAPYRKEINGAILKLQELGDLLKLKKRWWKEKNGGGQCKKDKGGGGDEMGLDHVGGVFVVLATGMCLAMIIAVFEFLWNVRKVAVVQRITPKEALIKELKFAMDIKIRKKAVLNPSTSAAILLDKLDDKLED